MICEDVVFTTETLTVTETRRISDNTGQIKCSNGQWYTFKDFINNWNHEALGLPYIGQRVRIEFDRFSNPIDWRSNG